MNYKNKFKLSSSVDTEKLYSDMKDFDSLFLAESRKKYKHFAQDWEDIQFICTWDKCHDKCQIELHPKVNFSAIEVQDPTLLIASWITDKTILKEEDIRFELLKEKFSPYVEMMNGSLEKYVKNARGRKYAFLCLGGAKNEFLHHFYRNRKIKTQLEIKEFIASVFAATVHTRKITDEKKLDDEEKLDDIGNCVYEFFSNTDKHGKTDINQNPIKGSVRSMSFHKFDFSKIDKKPSIQKSPRFKSFLATHKKIISISIFDNGEGIIKRYCELTTRKKESDLLHKNKIEIFKEVFKNWTTSSTVPNSGMGLANAKKHIESLKGAYLIRTNGIELFYTPDEKGEYQEQFRELSGMSGTLITILIPWDADR